MEDDDSLEIGERNTLVSPKTSKRSNKNEAIAGPSGIYNPSGQGNLKNVVGSQNASVVRKSKRDVCSLNMTNENKGNSDLEDAFIFPKRSKSINVSKKNLSVGNICYDSDNELNVASIIKLEPESDGSSNPININKSNLSQKTNHNRESDEIKSECKNKEQCKISTKSELNKKDKKTHKEFSSSTLNMLNRLL